MKTRVSFLLLFFVLALPRYNTQCFPNRHSTNWFEGWISCETTPNPNPLRGTTHWILYDFGTYYELGQSTFWNSNDPAHLDNGINEVVIDFSIDGIEWYEMGHFFFSQADGLSTYEGEPGPDFTGIALKYLLITPLSNFGGNCYSFSEAKFEVLDVNFSLIKIKALLQGPYDEATQLMRDDLRTSSEIPLTEPFTELGYTHVGSGGETLDSEVLATTGNNAIVDWVFVEVRTDTYSSDIYKTITALIQRDGDVVAIDGVSPLKLNIAWDYFVVLRHRNHFGLRNLTPILKNTIGIVDFTDADYAVFGMNSRIDINGKMSMITGDANRDGQINPVDKNTYWRIQNGNPFDYINSSADFNLDGTVNAVDKNNYWRVNNSKEEQVE